MPTRLPHKPLAQVLSLWLCPAPCLQIDCSNGDIVHVDFSCLFDKGLTLAKPEMVPFRCARAPQHGGRRVLGGALVARLPAAAACRGPQVWPSCLPPPAG